ncbi:MAG: hypothetical protein KME20_14505 [Kaiparowitsia implicata GSE-PSE-MK54-09C]|jgi:hypothetical protein|nr:hypothetical protein [Kaiparowitsia implicata GSE-PSE-MK54-09C]
MLSLNPTAAYDLETCIRNALTAGELTPDAQQHIHQLTAGDGLSRRDQALLALLEDAIADGCVQASSSPTSA